MAALKGKLFFQTIADKRPDRADHVWHYLGDHEHLWMCVLCGAVTHDPPPYPTDSTWLPIRFEKVTDEIQKLSEAKKN